MLKSKSASKNLMQAMPDFAGRLQEGERLLWEGRPNPASYNRARIIPLSLILLPFMPVFIWAIGAKTGVNLPLLSPLTLLLALGLWPLVCWAISSYMGEQTRWVAYALTDRRIFIRRVERQTSQDSRVKIEEFPLQMLRPRLRLSKSGGTITFGFPAMQDELAFREIPDAGTVFALLTDALAAMAPADTDTPYYLKKSASPPQAFRMEMYLRRGETILWEGGMDAATYWREQRVAIIVVHFLIPAAIGTYLEASGQWTPLWQAAAFVPALLLYPLWKAGVLRTPAGRSYALTNQRVLFVKKAGNRNTLEERDLRETMGMRLVRGKSGRKSGIGTIIFEKKTRIISHGQGASVETYELSFKHIADAERVYTQIIAARS